MIAPLKAESELLESCGSKLVSAALNAGAESAEVCGSFSQKTKIGLEKQDFHLASSDSGYFLGLRVLKNGRQGFTSTNSTDIKDLKLMAARAVEIAAFSPENRNYRVVSSGNIESNSRVSLWDDALFQLSLKSQQEWTKLLADEALKDRRFRLNEGSLEIGSSLFLIQNSLGTHKLERETHAAWSVMGMAVEDDLITSFDYFSALSRKREGITERILKTTQEFTKSVVATLKQAGAQTYEGPVMFSPRAVNEIFLDGLSYHLNGRVVGDGIGRWAVSDLGKKMVSGRITLQDIPWAGERWGTAYFDREGTPTSNRTVIENGELKGFFLDSYAAAVTGLASSGNAVGGPTSIPTVGPHTLSLSAGEKTKAALFAEAAAARKEFLVVHRFSGQVDPVTGDFSGVAKGAEWWVGGERTHFATETLISGNIFNCLGSALVGLSDTSESVDCGSESPFMLCDGVSVTSGKAS